MDNFICSSTHFLYVLIFFRIVFYLTSLDLLFSQLIPVQGDVTSQRENMGVAAVQLVTLTTAVVMTTRMCVRRVSKENLIQMITY